MSKQKHLSHCVVAIGIALMLGFFSTACSVGLAIHGKEQRDVSFLNVGTPRGIVQANLGTPDSSTQNSDSYDICKGDSPSMGRAVAHGVMDVLTVGLWEVVGTPIEAAKSGSDCKLVTVLYDENDKVMDIK